MDTVIDLLSSRFNLLIIDLIMPLVVGYILKEKKLLSQGQCNWLVKINIRVIVSLLSLLSFWSLHLTWKLAFLPVIGVMACVVPGLIAKFTFVKQYKEYEDKGAYMMAAMLANIGTLAGLGAFIIYGIIGFAYMQMVAIFQNLFTMLYCFPLANYYHNLANPHESGGKIIWWRLLVNPNQLSVIAMAIGFILSLNNIPQPQEMLTLFNALVHIGAWSGLLPVGFMVEFGEAKSYMLKTLDLVLVKFVILPLLAYVVFTQLFENHVLIGTLMLGFSAPTAINSVLAANLYKLNVNIPIASFMVTTCLFLLVVFPIFYFWGQYHL